MCLRSLSLSSYTFTMASNSRPTRKEVQEVQEILNEPLTDKKVMIPFTTRAFFPGTIHPEKSDERKEQVLVRMGSDNLVEMERHEARDFLEKRAELMQMTAALQRTRTSSPKSNSNKVTPSKPLTTGSSALPYFEIREEYDEKGRQVHAEAVNVVKELDYLQKRDSEEGGGEAARTSATSGDDGESDFPHDADESEKPTHVSDSDYARLWSRLDELERLEEEAKSKQKENRTSAKKLQSRGWGRGFLNKAPASKKKQVNVEATLTTQIDQPPTTTKKVAFREENEVRQIPRVGDRSASDFRPAPSLRRPIESDVFSGVIRERSEQKATNHQTTNVSSTSSGSSKPQKKLSRFAQERMQGGMS